ncbi:discoidin domain-containing protein [Amedibacillus dolichus]|uniref:discoidin domain-containing protein n=1 Tax=Amedibacillus dolichus TaxID=31971 RepID=UPI00241CBD0F|nr:discoidin domain-containing protein [Amedibacillus dolichus]
MASKKIKKLSTAAVAATMVLPTVADGMMIVSAKENKPVKAEDTQSQLPPVKDGYTYLSKVKEFKQEGNVVTFTMEQGERLRFTFLDENVFRMYMAAPGKDFEKDPTPNSPEHKATIRAKTDDQYYDENKVNPVVERAESVSTTILTKDIKIVFDEKTSMMTVTNKDNQVILKETAPIQYKEGSTIQTLATDKDEYFYGGGTQNGRFSHKGKKIEIVNSNNWVDGGVASPNPFYWSSKGYGVVRNTWKPGSYDFTSNDQITTTHNEERFDAYFFIEPVTEKTSVSTAAKAILGDYYELTGKPIELPEYASYLGHLNCYNRDYWKETTEGNGVKLGDKWYTESQSNNGGQKETLNGSEPFSAKSILDEYKTYDMPVGWFLPNDGYGCGYGQASTQDGNIANLKQFADESIAKGVQTGLWTQSNLYPADPSNPKPEERDLDKEVQAGTHAIKTDVAWVGAGYSFALNGVQTAYNGILKGSGMKPNVVSLDGWAGTQRYAGIWTGDQSGGQWEYIRFHIPTYIGTSLSGQPNVGSDMDGIFGGKNQTVQTRDFQWKAFTTFMLDMDGWGSSQKTPWALGKDNESINRAYLKMKAQLMPYINTISHEATAEGGLPMVRAMFLEEENAYTLGTATQYQYMWGDQFLVAPIYRNTASDDAGNDIRNDIYLPSTSEVWVDYFTGKQYRGGQILNNFDAPLWKLPVFVKNGSIIPMYAENNNPEAKTETNKDGLDRSQRIVEFYPSGSTEFTQYEDDGKTHGGGSATTKFTSVVEGDKATLTAEPTVGSYESMVNERSTEFIVNVSKAPTKVKGTVANQSVEFKKVDTLEEYNKATGNVYFYDAAPETIVEQYASKGSKYENMEETQAPKLRVKSTDKVGVTNKFQVVVEGFENKQDLGKNELDQNLAVPTGLKSTEKTSSTITMGWDESKDAVSYDIEIDGNVYRNILKPTYLHEGLNYSTDYTYRVRAVNAEGNYSNWSDPVTVTTDDDPYRNVPEPVEVTWTGDIYGNHNADLAFDRQFQAGDGGFHSNGNSIGQDLIVDLGKFYQLDKLEYYPRSDAGNGTVTKMDISTSMDGIHWSEPTTYDWARDNTTKTVALSDVKARYVKMTPKASVGNFFAASEIMIYKKDGTEGKVVGDANNSGALEENDLVFFENYAGLIPEDKDWEYVKNMNADLDSNGLCDAFDLAYVATQLNGGISNPAQGVEGKIRLVPSKTKISKGETITVDVYGIGLKNVNSFSVNIPVDSATYSMTAASITVDTANMRNFSKLRTHSNNTVDNFIMMSNIGKQETLNGTGILASFTVTANKDFEWNIRETSAALVGQDLSYEDGMIDYSQKPEAPVTKKVLTKAEAPVTFATEGTAVQGSELWQQSNWNDLLFDGNTSGSMAEFKWDLPNSQIDFGENVKLPMDFTFDVTKDGKARSITTFKIYGRESSNGALKKSKLSYIDENGKKHDLEASTSTSPSWEINDKVKQIIWTPMESVGQTEDCYENRLNRMLSLYEVEITEDSAVAATGITFDDTSVKTLKVGEVGNVSATVAPENVTNPFYHIVSSNPDVVSVTEIPTADSYLYQVQGMSKGEATLTATSEDGKFTAQWKVTVEDGLNYAELDKQIAEAEALAQRLYTEESWVEFQKVVDAGKAVKENPDATQAMVNKAALDIKTAQKNLKLKGSLDTNPDSKNLIDQTTLEMYDESSCSAAEQEHADRTIDGDKNTIWHSNYNKGYTLPQYFTIDLGKEYSLEQVDYLPRQGSRNGHVTHYRIETSLDGKKFEPVVEGFFETEDGSLKDPSEFKKVKFDKTDARYVRFIALESLGDTPNAYASCAEINFYGVEVQSVDFAELSKLIQACENEHIDSSKYTANSWSAYQTALTAAKAIKEDSDSAEIAKAYSALKVAEEGLKVRASEAMLTSLKNVVAEADKSIADGATSAELEKLVAEAKELLADSTNAEGTVVLECMANLKAELGKVSASTEIKKLKEGLQEDVDYITESIMSNTDGYRPVDVEAMQKLLDEAKAVIAKADATKDEVVDVHKRLADQLTKMVKVDKSTLESAIETASKLDPNEYTPESYQVLADAIEAGKAVLANENATNKDVADAVDTIAKAIEGLVVDESKDLNKADLQLEIDMTKSILAEADKYTPDSLVGLEEALAKAEKALAEATTQEEIDAATDELRTQRREVRVAADKTELNKAITRAHNLNLNLYTPSSAQNVRNALSNAKDILADENATQEQVDIATDALNKAIDSLEMGTEDPNNPNGGNESGNGSGQGNGSGSGNNSGSQGNGSLNSGSTTNGEKPNTGDESKTAGYGILSILTLGGLFGLLKSKKKEEKASE